MMSVKKHFFNNKKSLLALSLGTLFLSGCAVGPDYQQPKLNDLPAHWSASSNPIQQLQLARWWENFNDPLLNQLVNDAVRGNLDVASAKASVREARASYTEATGDFYPSLSLSTKATRSGKAASSTGEPTNVYSAGFDASWELDLFGANRRAAEAAKYGVDAAREELRATLLTLIGDVTATYVDVRGYQERLVLAKNTAASQRSNEELTKIKYEAGAVSAVDMAEASGQASSSEASIPSLENSYRAALHSLSVLTGQQPNALNSLLAQIKPVPVPPATTATGVPADILLNRPDVRVAERELAQATANIGAAKAAQYPTITLTGSITTSALQFGDLAKNSSIGWSFGPSIYLPLFQGGKLKAGVEVAEAQRDQRFIAYQSAVLTALQDVADALVSLDQERVRADRLAEAAKNYRLSAELSRSLYQVGNLSLLNVLTTERSLYSAEDPLIQSHVAIAKDYIALNKALGGGWDDEVDTQTPYINDTSSGMVINTTNTTNKNEQTTN